MSSPGAVTFSYANWVARYPEFAGVSSGTAQLYFNEATLYCANQLDPVPDIATLAMLLNMVTSHIAALNSTVTPAGQNPLTPPGRVSQASEGSVSATFDFSLEPGSKDWFSQTKYGAAFWAAVVRYRTFRYRRSCGPIGGAGRPWLYPNS